MGFDLHCQPLHDPTAGGLSGGDESWAEAKAGCALAQIPVIWVLGFFFCFLGSCKVLPVSFWIWELILWPRGHPLGRAIFCPPFLGVDARSEQQKAAETEEDERASSGTSLPVFGGHQPGMAALELPGEEEQGALAPILAGEGWRSSSSMEQHPRGTSITPLRGQAIPGHGPQRISRAAHPRGLQHFQPQSWTRCYGMTPRPLAAL